MHLTAIFAGALAAALLSAFAAYRLSGSDAWRRAYNDHGMGLAIESVFVLLLFCAVISVAMIMRDAFGALFFRDGWRSRWFLGAGAVIGGGVLVYMNVFAPRILAREQNVPPGDLGPQCRRPYLFYTPYSVVIWLALILPLVAMVCVSIGLDHGTMAGAIGDLRARSGEIAGLSAAADEVADTRLALLQLEYREAVATVQVIVNRYLWVVGTFMIFLIVMLNTKITTIFTEEAQDFFKWLMWVLLMIAVGICCFGLWRFQIMRSLVEGAYTRLYAAMTDAGAVERMVAVKEELLTLKAEGTISFLRRTLDGGGLWLLFFSYGAQILLAKVTHRSVLKIIFPRGIARFLDEFMEVEKESGAS